MKTALVTGAARGIGRAIALKLAENGFNVFLNCVKSSDGLLELASEIEKKGVIIISQ